MVESVLLSCLRTPGKQCLCLEENSPSSFFYLFSFTSLPLIDHSVWYYPSQGYDDSDEELLDIGVRGGNWGNKMVRGARWVRRGKIAAWGPGMDEWEVREVFFE